MILKFFWERSRHRNSNCETYYCTYGSYVFWRLLEY